MKRPRTINPGDLAQIDRAIELLRSARFYLRNANSDRTLAKVRSAIKSAEGSRRHAAGLLSRQAADRVLSGHRSLYPLD